MKMLLLTIATLILIGCGETTDKGMFKFTSHSTDNCDIVFSININNEKSIFMENDDTATILMREGIYDVWITESSNCSGEKKSQLYHTQIFVSSTQTNHRNIYPWTRDDQ